MIQGNWCNWSRSNRSWFGSWIGGEKPIESFKKRVTFSPPVINVIKNFPFPSFLLISRKTPPRFSRIFSWSIDDLKTARSQGEGLLRIHKMEKGFWSRCYRVKFMEHRWKGAPSLSLSLSLQGWMELRDGITRWIFNGRILRSVN